jgi:hypothetical protein
LKVLVYDDGDEGLKMADEAALGDGSCELFSPFILRSRDEMLERSKLLVCEDSLERLELFCVPTRNEKGEPRTSEPLKYT